MTDNSNQENPIYPYRWEFLDEEKEFDFDKDVVLSTCEWKGRKLSLFDDFLQSIEENKEETND